MEITNIAIKNTERRVELLCTINGVDYGCAEEKNEFYGGLEKALMVLWAAMLRRISAIRLAG